MTVPLYRQIYQYLIEEIQQGRLKSGDRVPSEKELAENFNVSRITSKKALEMLAQAQLIDRERGRGSFVAQQLPSLNGHVAFVTEEDGLTPTYTATIGVIMPDFSDVYGVRLLQAIEQRCSEIGYQLVMKLTYGRLDEENRAIHKLTEHDVDGLIVHPVHGEYYNADLLRLILADFPLVVVDRYLKGIPAHSVYTDNISAAEQLTHYLLQQGHQHVAFVSPPADNTSTIEDRVEGYRTALAKQQLPFRRDYCFTEIMSPLPRSFNLANVERDQIALQAFIERQPQITAFVANEYNVALVLRATLKQMHREDEIACFDYPQNTLEPPLFTYIRQDEEAIGKTAVDLLHLHLEGKRAPLQKVIDFELVLNT